MTTQGFALFDTVIGRCGLAWGDRGLIGVQLPEATPGAAWARLRKRFPDAVEVEPPPEIEVVIDRIRDLLAGGRDDLADIVLDLEGQSAFHLRVYAIARAIPPGETSTYGEVARAMGEPGAARAVGNALANNPFPLLIPCHRVIRSGGHLGGFGGGLDLKRTLLALEGIEANASEHVLSPPLHYA